MRLENMPCSRCGIEGHMSRDCPERQLVPQLRPRISSRNRRVQGSPTQRAILNFVERYNNFLPLMVQTYPYFNNLVSHGAIPYNVYELPRGDLQRMHSERQAAVNDMFLNPETNLARLIYIHNQNAPQMFIGLGYPSNSGIHLLIDEPYPENGPLYLIMPNLERFESPVLRPKLVSDYVKNWNVILDLTNIQGVSTEVECVICADTKPLCRIAKTECGHEYCVDCVKSDIRENKDKTKKPMCPLCRT